MYITSIEGKWVLMTNGLSCLEVKKLWITIVVPSGKCISLVVLVTISWLNEKSLNARKSVDESRTLCWKQQSCNDQMACIVTVTFCTLFMFWQSMHLRGQSMDRGGRDGFAKKPRNLWSIPACISGNLSALKLYKSASKLHPSFCLWEIVPNVF